MAYLTDFTHIWNIVKLDFLGNIPGNDAQAGNWVNIQNKQRKLKQTFKQFLYIPLERESSFPQGLGLSDLLRKNKIKQSLRTSISIYKYTYFLSSWRTCRNSGGKPSKLCGGNARGQLGYLVQMREWHVCWYTDLSERFYVSSKEHLAIQSHNNCDLTLGLIWIIRINIHCIHNKSLHFTYLN